VVGWAPRALRNCAPSALSAEGARPLNFAVRGQLAVPILAYGASPIRRLYFWR